MLRQYHHLDHHRSWRFDAAPGSVGEGPAWFVGVMMLLIYVSFAGTLYWMLPVEAG